MIHGWHDVRYQIFTRHTVFIVALKIHNRVFTVEILAVFKVAVEAERI